MTYRRILLQLSAFLICPVSIYGAKLVIWLVGLMLIAGLPAIGKVSWRLNAAARPLLLALFALVGWGAVSALWSPDPARSLIKAGEILALFTGLAAFTVIYLDTARTTGVRLLPWATAGFGLAFSAFLFETLSGGVIISWLKPGAENLESQFSPYNHGLAVLAVMSWPVAYGLWRAQHSWIAGAVPLATIALVWSFYGTAIAIAASLGLVICVAMVIFPRRGPVVFASVMAVVIVVTPFAARWALGQYNPRGHALTTENISISHRLIVWEFAAKRILERPFVGWGMDASRLVPGANEKLELGRRPPRAKGSLLPNHPHNGALQLWLELGLPGALLGAFAVYVLTHLIAAGPALNTGRAAALSQLTIFLAVGGLSYGIWQSWLYAIGSLAFVLSMPLYRPSGEVPDPSHSTR